MPVSGGPETMVLDRETGQSDWDVTDRGIYFPDWNAKPVAIMCFYDFATRRVRSLAPVHSGPAFQPEKGLSVSPDGKWLVYSGGFGTQDVWMIDNFQ